MNTGRGYLVHALLIAFMLALGGLLSAPAKAHGPSAAPQEIAATPGQRCADGACLGGDEVVQSLPEKDSHCGDRHSGGCTLLWCGGTGILGPMGTWETLAMTVEQPLFPIVVLISAQVADGPFRPPRNG